MAEASPQYEASPGPAEPGSAAAFLAGVARFDQFGQPTRCTEEGGIRYLANEFWTSGQRRAHALQEVSYRACFKAQLPEFFIARLTRPGDTVYDPFAGRGTTAVQANLMRRRVAANDINPLSVLLCRPRLGPIRLPAVQAALAGVDWQAGGCEREDLLAFYHPATLRQLASLRRWLAARAPLDAVEVDPVADWIRMVALNRLSGHSPGFFSGRSLPPNQAVSVAAQQRINRRLGATPPERDAAGLILKKTRSLLRHGAAPPAAGPVLSTAPAWDTPLVATGSVDLVVTSPPFLDVVQYAADNWLRCWFAGIDPESVAIDLHRSEAAWEAMTRRVLGELGRVVRPGGFVAFEVGEVRGGRVLLERGVWRAAAGSVFRRIAVMVNVQEFTKTAHCWGVANGRMGTNTNRIVLLQRR